MLDENIGIALAIDAQAKIHQALSNPVRLHILALLRKHEERENMQSIGDKLATLGYALSQSPISYHFSVLEDAGLIRLQEKDGRDKYYEVCQEAIAALRETLP